MRVYMKWVWGLFFIITAWLAFSKEKELKRSQIIKFSHKYHIEEVGASCEDCHTKAPESTKASDNLLGTMDDCATCHDVETEAECQLCHFEDQSTWIPFTNPSRELNFNHKFHLEKEGLKCEDCHKNLGKVDFANQASLPTMQDCARCHNNQQATLECAGCHTNTLNLRPADHTADFLVTHKNLARIDQENCAVCHTSNDCSECHEGATLFTTRGKPSQDIQTPFHISSRGTKGLILQRVHELNYRVTHPLEAEGRSQECAVCHEARNFCQACHEAEGVDVAGKPAWHGGADWVPLRGAVGSGGGRHAELARRDIESCASCHNTQGDDPTCLLCHTDFDGVKGTDPKTHGSGFADRFGEGSSFHNDDSAICYTCHTNTHQAGVGFCGYCHGPKED